jgi:hypothetical protein
LLLLCCVQPLLRVLFWAHQFICELTTKCYGMGQAGRGVTTMVQHKAERARPKVNGRDLALVIDCLNEQHGRLQEAAD